MIVKMKQYGLRHFIATTVHRIIGDTVKSIITQVSAVDTKFKLWEAEQAVVVL